VRVANEEPKHAGARRIGEIMIPLDEYPHIPDQFTLAQAIMELERAELEFRGRRSLPRLLLVFNQNNELAGLVRRRDLLRGLEPKFMRAKSMDYRKRLFDVELDPNLLEMAYEKIIDGMKERAQRSVRSIMITDVVTIDYDDHLLKAIYEMVTYDITSLPVVKDNRVVGVVRTVEIFHEVANLVL
jgi:CBS domain-containing protein